MVTGILMFVLEVQCQMMAYQVLINEVPVISDYNCQGKTRQYKINQWVVKGENSMRIMLKKPAGEEQEAGGISPSFKLTLQKGVHGQEPGPEGLLASYVWNPEERPLTGDTPVSVHSAFTIAEAFGRWVWEDAGTAALTPVDTSEIHRLVYQVNVALQQRDENALLKMLRLKHTEMARALGISAEYIEQGMRKQLASYFSAQDWQIAPINYEQMIMQPCAGNRIVKLMAPGGEAPVQGKAADRPYRLDLFVSKINGQWAIVR